MADRGTPALAVVLVTLLLGITVTAPAAATTGSEAATSGGSGFGGTAAVLASTVAFALFARRR